MSSEVSAQSPAVRFEDDLVIPPDVGDFARFRRWSLSEEFPQSGRVDYLRGTVEVDMSPEDLQSHGALKSALHLYVGQRVAVENLGQVFVDRARVTSSEAGLSCEPDVVFVSWEALREGRARYLPSSVRRPGRLLEIEGAVDLIVEVVSDSSRRKDTERLPPLYAAAGARELWIADARGEQIEFRILHLTADGYSPALRREDGFQRSEVLQRWLRLRRTAGPVADTWIYEVEEAG